MNVAGTLCAGLQSFTESTEYASSAVMQVLASLRIWMSNCVPEQGLSCDLCSPSQKSRGTSLGFVEFDFAKVY